MKDQNGWLEQMNYSALQGILTDAKSEKAYGVSLDKSGEGPTKEGQAEIDQVMTFQKEMMRLLASLKGEPELTFGKEKAPFSDTTANNAIAINLQQQLLKERQNADSDFIQVSQKRQLMQRFLQGRS